MFAQLRYRVWEEEGAINAAAFPDKSWLDRDDDTARHWVVRRLDTGEVVAAARLTLHASLDDDSRDVALWRRCGKHLPMPTTDLGRLVVLQCCRGRGVAQSLNQVRVEAARLMGARSVMATASEGNARLLLKLGFTDIGETISFDDRPGVVFHALQLDFPAPP